ncbi:hypothetical protein AMECASPLE_005151, partial [Ameca splendens]
LTNLDDHWQNILHFSKISKTLNDCFLNSTFLSSSAASDSADLDFHTCLSEPHLLPVRRQVQLVRVGTGGPSSYADFHWTNWWSFDVSLRPAFSPPRVQLLPHVTPLLIQH